MSVLVFGLIQCEMVHMRQHFSGDADAVGLRDVRRRVERKAWHLFGVNRHPATELSSSCTDVPVSSATSRH